MTTQEQNVFLSKWGFHPVSYETFLKLKRLKKLYWAAVRAFCQWRRWERKEPQNRFYWLPKKYGVKRKRSTKPIPEPRLCKVWMTENREKWQDGKWVKPATPLDDRGILAAFEAARMPKKNATDVEPISLSDEEIDKMLAAAELWYSTQR